jgi:hypothetical protein
VVTWRSGGGPPEVAGSVEAEGHRWGGGGPVSTTAWAGGSRAGSSELLDRLRVASAGWRQASGVLLTGGGLLHRLQAVASKRCAAVARRRQRVTAPGRAAAATGWAWRLWFLQA